MARQTEDNGLGNLLGLAVIALIIGSVIYSVWGTSEPLQQPVEQPKVVQKQTQGPSTSQIIESLGIGDGKLDAASSISASDLGKATPISGGGITGGSSSSSTRRSSSSSGAQSSSPPTRSGG